MNHDPRSTPHGDRLTQLNIAVALMGNTAWKNSIGAPEHDHTMGSEQGITHGRDGAMLTRIFNCPRCGDATADRYWQLALDEAALRVSLGEAGPSGKLWGAVIHHEDGAA